MTRALAFLLFGFSCFSSIAREPSTSSAPTSEILIEAGSMWDGTALPPYPEGKPKISIVKFLIPPHSQLPMHKHPSINAGYVVKGTLKVFTENGKELTLKAGEALIELVDKWHYGRNDGDEAVEIVVFYAGTPGVPLAVKKDAPAPAKSE